MGCHCLLLSTHDYWKNCNFDYMNLHRLGDVSALNTLSRFVIAFLSKSKCLLISWLQSPSAVILEPKKVKSVTVSIVSPYICREVMGLDAMILVFLMLSFKPVSPLSSFIKRLFSSSSLSAIRVVSSAYLKLLIFLLAILIPACASSSLAFHMMHFVYKLNRVTVYSLDVLLSQFETSPLFHIQFQLLHLTCIQISQEAGKVFWYSHLLKNFP